ncbi:hypothetical protein BVC71_02805 [Marivivens niveibacter]|uniref:Glycosyltransferase n=1 Tax=Marivivens niveibacter TaxID=1930667 RepID=A0A251X235_9RHOB|nr:WecB/TagA/CpsF family glycosyltransferase [Marivivens niveibacter]OUD10448.1 hypothetical protein BVC71_02805 [Marivivens niveibacter]
MSPDRNKKSPLEQPPYETFEVLGIPIMAVSLDKASELIADWSNDKIGRYVGVREVASTVALSETSELLNVARGAAMNVPDGMPLVWIGRRRGLNVSRTCGPDLMEQLLTQEPGVSLKHFFYGGKEGVADILKQKFSKRSDQLQVVGTHCPPFRELTNEENEAVLEKIKASGADVVWVGISSPKQDIWMAQNAHKTQATMIGVGAAFDFHSGSIKRAPKWMQRSGLEFLHRLCSEPSRLWRRYLIMAPRFVWRITIGEKKENADESRETR